MSKPKMILFDYGGTLIYEPAFNPSNGNKAIYPYISKNPHKISPEEYDRYVQQFFDEIRSLRGELIEIHEHIFLRNVLEHFEMELSVSLEEAEWILWNGISKGVATPGAGEMLHALQKQGIRTGVVSNLCWSKAALTRRLEEVFPDHPFEFVLTSSEYIFRKPDPHLFEMAIRKSGLKKQAIWFCGNDMEMDVAGAYHVGLQPVFYEDRSVPGNLHEKNAAFHADFPYLKIHHWQELVEKIFLER